MRSLFKILVSHEQEPLVTGRPLGSSLANYQWRSQGEGRGEVGKENGLNKPLLSAPWWKEEFYPAAQHVSLNNHNQGWI